MPRESSETRRWTIYRGADAVTQDEGFEPVRWEYPSQVEPELRAGEEVEVMPVSEHEAVVKEMKDLCYALFRSNIDWAKEAAECGDEKCCGDCRYLRDVRRLVREWDGGILPGPQSGHFERGSDA